MTLSPLRLKQRTRQILFAYTPLCNSAQSNKVLLQWVTSSRRQVSVNDIQQSPAESTPTTTTLAVIWDFPISYLH